MGDTGKHLGLDVEAPDGHSLGDSIRSARLAVTFESVTYRVRSSHNKKEWATLLRDVTGYLAPGEMTAILGPSGSGKTTLLDLLCFRKTVGELAPDSRILYGGQRPGVAFLRRNLGYVEQFDTLLPALTVHDMLLYTVQLKYPRTTPQASKQLLVDELIQKLNLEECQGTVIGSVMSRGISGGEAKRTNIGISLITSPLFLLLDEPTSGLDSYNAHSVVKVVKGLVAGGITICSTIHSPPPYTFDLFDRVLVLQRGRVAYFGANGQAVLEYFASSFPELRGPGRWEGVADFVVDVTTQAAKAQAAGKEAPAFEEAYACSALREECQQRVQEYLVVTRSLPASVLSEVSRGMQSLRQRGGLGNLLGGGHQGTATPLWWGLLTLWRYRSLTNFRRFDYIAPRILDKAAIMFIMVTLYWGVGDQIDPESVTTVAAILYMWAILTAYGAMGMLPLLILERPAYLRERADGLYRPVTYLVFKFSEETFTQSVASLPYALLVFFLVRLQGSFLLVWLLYAISMAIAVALALLAGALFSRVDAAGATLPAYVTTLLYFAGFFIPWEKIPIYWKWYAVIDYLRYSWGALMVNQFGGNNNIVAFGSVRVLEFYGLENVDKWAWVGWTALFLGVFLSFAWVALVTVQHQKR